MTIKVTNMWNAFYKATLRKKFSTYSWISKMDSKNERQANFSEGGGVGERRCHKLQNYKLEVFAVSYK